MKTKTMAGHSRGPPQEEDHRHQDDDHHQWGDGERQHGIGDQRGRPQPGKDCTVDVGRHRREQDQTGGLQGLESRVD